MKTKHMLVALLASVTAGAIFGFWFVYIRLTPTDRLLQAYTPEQVVEALKAGADPNACRAAVGGKLRPVIFRIVRQGGEEESLRALLAAGADPNVRNPMNGETPLLEQVSYSIVFREVPPAELRRVRLLLSHGADPCVTNRAGKNVYDLIESRNSDAAWMGRLGPADRTNWRQLSEIFEQYRRDKANGVEVNAHE